MKKVWILEKWVSREDIEEFVKLYRNMLNENPDLDAVNTVADKYEADLADPNYNGYWNGYVGRVKYTEFCIDARNYIARHRNSNDKLRVVTAYINDNATTWVGYKNAVENEDVFKYLYATV